MFQPQPTPYAHTFYSYGGYDDGVNEYPAASAAASAAGCFPADSESIPVSIPAPPGATALNFGLGVGGGGFSSPGPGPAPTPSCAWPESARSTRHPSAPAPGISGAPPASSPAALSVPAAAAAAAAAGAPHHHHHHQPQQTQAVFYSQHSQPSFPPIPNNTDLKAEVPRARRSNDSTSRDCLAVWVNPSIHSSTTAHPQSSSLNMDPNGTIWLTPQQTSDMEAQQEAAKSYQPDFEGPPVGEKISSLSITEDYAKGNPIFVEKTTNLPQTYSHYRPIRGDGNCGWRAIGFAYFESLIQSGDPNRLRQEHDRIRQLNSYIAQAGGYDESIWEDMASETSETFDGLSQVMTTNPDHAVSLLRERLSTQESADAILYHLRLMAASWMKGHPDDFVGFIDGGAGIDAYCRHKIEIPGGEIEALSITALYQVLLRPAGIPMQIAYLDTSPGSQANIHYYHVDDSGQQMTPEVENRTVYLLYRPGHYDILYRLPPPTHGLPAPAEIQVNLVSGFGERHQYGNNMGNLQNFDLDMSHLSMIPGSSFLGIGPGPLRPGAPPPLDEFVPSPQSPWLTRPRPPYSEPESPIQKETYQQEEQSSSSTSPSTFDTNHPLRFSRYQYQQEVVPAPPPSIPEDNEMEQPAFKTRLFKDSHYNPAHYNNPNFHPEEYDPVAEECPYYARGTAKRRAKIPLRVASDAD